MGYLGRMNKEIREKRSKQAEEWIPTLRENLISMEFNEQSNCYALEDRVHGRINYFPKANKIYLYRRDKWIKPGLKWLISNVINRRVPADASR